MFLQMPKSPNFIIQEECTEGIHVIEEGPSTHTNDDYHDEEGRILPSVMDKDVSSKE
jgi:hypothetical protein